MDHDSTSFARRSRSARDRGTAQPVPAGPGAERLEDRCVPASLFPGNPVDIGMPVVTTGVGNADVTTALANFQAAIGGDEQQRQGLAPDGWVPDDQLGRGQARRDRLRRRAKHDSHPPGQDAWASLSTGSRRGRVFFGQVYAVSDDGFVDVNPNVTGLFPAFSPTNTFAMFNDNTIDLSFVLPGTGTTPSQRPRRVRRDLPQRAVPTTSSIEYFSGDTSLGKVFVPVGATRAIPSSLGVLFPDAVVTRVTLHPRHRRRSSPSTARRPRARP